MKFALLLAGCGQHDGSETHEVVLTLLALSQEGVDWDAFAPDKEQSQVVNHITSEKIPEKRSVLVESSRLVRGRVKSLKGVDLNNYDAVIIPGGFGAVSNLCDWDKKGESFDFDPEVESFLSQATTLKKPMGFICIAPVMIPKLYKNAKLTIGNDADLAEQINKSGSEHVACNADDVVVDEINKVVSTPANMVANSINDVYLGTKKLVKELVKMSS